MDLEDIAEPLVRLAEALVDQEAARVLVEPAVRSEGYWFGGGDLVRDSHGCYWLCGRYRNHGDSRTGVGAGERGLELAVFRSDSPLGPFEKALSFSKQDLSVTGHPVVSIEGASLHLTEMGVELFVSTEKAKPYPDAIHAFQKPGTGYWDIDVMSAETVGELDPSRLRPAIGSETPATLHVKDPVAFALPGEEEHTALVFCSHPFTWASSNTGLAVREAGESKFQIENFELMPRGAVWDVAATRVTDRLAVPPLGVLADVPPLSLYFYDGAECLRRLDESEQAVSRPRGYSCEELGGLAVGYDETFPSIRRLTVDGPLFVSPHGTGCSRYVSTLVTGDGILATWQQSQDDLSQPLVGHFLPMAEVERLLSGKS